MWLLFGGYLKHAQPLQKVDILIYTGPCLTVPDGTSEGGEQVTHVPGVRTLATRAASPVPIASGQIPTEQLTTEDNNSGQIQMALCHMPAPPQSGLW